MGKGKVEKKENLSSTFVENYMVETGFWKSAKFIPKKCGKAQITSLIKHRCGKLILRFCGTEM